MMPANSKLRLNNWTLLGLLALLLVGVASCDDDDGPGPMGPDTDLIMGPAEATPYQLEVNDFMPALPSANVIALSEEGIELGRRLFYDPILSNDSTMSCSSCHLQELAFTDGLSTSPGVLGQRGSRNSMSLVNLVYNDQGFFWDGRSPSLEEQAIHPVEDMLELNSDWDEALDRIRATTDYPTRFRAAFGIDRKSEITRDLVTRAIAQFETTIISDNTRFDRYTYLLSDLPTSDEIDGAELFFIEFATPDQVHPGCSHCHNKPRFSNNRFFNNGLENVASLEDFPDPGHGVVTGSVFDNGKFRTPTLRNIALTAPYMHDGRFATLEEVLDHYASGGHAIENRDPNITGFELSEENKRVLLAFLESLTDDELISDPRFSNPFE